MQIHSKPWLALHHYLEQFQPLGQMRKAGLGHQDGRIDHCAEEPGILGLLLGSTLALLRLRRKADPALQSAHLSELLLLHLSHLPIK